uniref:Zinc finger RANBP2-type containing 3 n=1 Tax=Pseudonaja textilis TaxID=8673 RepID=A0A670YZK1_PSETE
LPRVGLPCSNSDVDEEFSYLPEKLKEKLLPFQKKGIIFALERSGSAFFSFQLIDIIVVQNKTDIWQIPKSKVTVLGYGLLTSDAHVLIDTLCKQKFKVVIIDESHYMKSRNAVRSKILLPIVQKAIRAILLTGTPALGRPEELFMQLEALCPKKFGTWTEYAQKYCNAYVRYFGKRRQWDCRGASNLDELHELLSNVMIRRMKSEVLTQLPPKIRQRIPFDLPKNTVKELNTSFEEWEKLMRASNLDSTKDDFVQVMSLITRMFKQTAIAKAGAVKDYIKMLLENEQLKFLVFAHHLSMLQACTEAVIESKVRYIRIDGSVPSAERINLVNQFQKDPDTRVAILSIQAAGQLGDKNCFCEVIEHHKVCTISVSTCLSKIAHIDCELVLLN